MKKWLNDRLWVSTKMQQKWVLLCTTEKCWLVCYITAGFCAHQEMFFSLFIDRNNQLFKEFFNIFGTPVCYCERMKCRVLSCKRKSCKKEKLPKNYQQINLGIIHSSFKRKLLAYDPAVFTAVTRIPVKFNWSTISEWYRFDEIFHSSKAALFSINSNIR